MGWLNKKPDETVELNLIPSSLIATLNSLNRESLIISTSGKILFSTEKIALLNLVNEAKISSEELLALVRVVRRTGATQEGSIEVARGPIGQGKRELQITAALISQDGMVLVIIDDEGEKQTRGKCRQQAMSKCLQRHTVQGFAKLLSMPSVMRSSK